MDKNRESLFSLCFFAASLAYIICFWLLRVTFGGKELMDLVHSNVCFSMFAASFIGTFGLFVSEPRTPELLVASKVFLFLTLVAALSLYNFTNVFLAYLALSGVIWIVCSVITSLKGLFYKKGFFWTFVVMQIIWSIYAFASFALAVEISASC